MHARLHSSFTVIFSSGFADRNSRNAFRISFSFFYSDIHIFLLLFPTFYIIRRLSTTLLKLSVDIFFLSHYDTSINPMITRIVPCIAL